GFWLISRLALSHSALGLSSTRPSLRRAVLCFAGSGRGYSEQLYPREASLMRGVIQPRPPVAGFAATKQFPGLDEKHPMPAGAPRRAAVPARRHRDRPLAKACPLTTGAPHSCRV